MRWLNIIQIRNNALWDGPHLDWMWGIFYKILSVPQNIVMDLNNVMDLNLYITIGFLCALNMIASLKPTWHMLTIVL